MNQPELYLGSLNCVYTNLLKLAYNKITVFVYEEQICNHHIYNSWLILAIRGRVYEETEFEFPIAISSVWDLCPVLIILIR